MPAVQTGTGTTAASSAPVTVSASVSSDSKSFVPSGTVTLTNSQGTAVGTIAVSSGTGQTTLTAGSLSPDPGPLSGTYAAGTTYGASTATTPLQVGYTPVTVSVPPPHTPPTAGVNTVITGSVSASSGTAAPAGTITLNDGSATGPVLASGPVTAASSGTTSTWSVTIPGGLTQGSHTLYATFSDAENRFAAGQRTLDCVALAGAGTCITPTLSSPKVPTRVDGVLAQEPVTMSAVPQSDSCAGFGLTPACSRAAPSR